MPNDPNALSPVTARILEHFSTACREAFGEHLRSIVLYGSAAEGRQRSTSDVNLLLMLTRFAADEVDRIREPLRTEQAAVQPKKPFVDPYAIACLRSGPAEAIRVLLLSLVDRGLIERSGEVLSAGRGARDTVRRPLEKQVLSCLVRPMAAYELEALLVGVFGVDALEGSAHTLAEQMFPKAVKESGTAGSGCGSSCSSSSGSSCGSSCGGGGCGGCGS